MSGENGHQFGDGKYGLGGMFGPPFKGFPSLPIVTPDPPPRTRTQAQKYGGLFYIGIGGLAVLIALVGWFGVRVWTLREVWTNIYILHDRGEPEVRRIEAAFALSRDPRTTAQQRWDIALRKELPELARYLIAESLGADVVTDSLRGYPLAVARSEDWPSWLRVLLTRPLALAAADGAAIAVEPLDELRKHPDPMVGLWAAFAEAVSPKSVQTASPKSVAAAVTMLDEAAKAPVPARELAELLRDARTASDDDRRALLDRATVWLRTHQPEAARIWKDWEVRDGKLVHEASP